MDAIYTGFIRAGGYHTPSLALPWIGPDNHRFVFIVRMIALFDRRKESVHVDV
jgi:hypothetical protein